MQVVSLIQKCSESNGETVQLGMVRAVLTVTTAEHFVLHGDALISVRPNACKARKALQGFSKNCTSRVMHGSVNAYEALAKVGSA